MIKHRLSKVEARIKPKKAAKPLKIIVHHLKDGEAKPEPGPEGSFSILVIHTKDALPGLGLKPEPSDEELEAEIARLEAELKGKAKQ